MKLNNIVNRLYALSQAFNLVGNEVVAKKLNECCEIMDDEIQSIESEFEDYEITIAELETPKWSGVKPTESGYYLWKELNRPSCNMNRRIAKIKKSGMGSDLFVSFEEPQSGLEEYTKLSLIADRDWLKVGEL